MTSRSGKNHDDGGSEADILKQTGLLKLVNLDLKGGSCEDIPKQSGFGPSEHFSGGYKQTGLLKLLNLDLKGGSEAHFPKQPVFGASEKYKSTGEYVEILKRKARELNLSRPSRYVEAGKNREIPISAGESRPFHREILKLQKLEMLYGPDGRGFPGVFDPGPRPKSKRCKLFY